MAKLTPPDPKQCQTIIRNGSFLSFGKPTETRCTNVPTHIIKEKHPNMRDGTCGSMSVCDGCLEKAKRQLGDAIESTPIKAASPRRHTKRALASGHVKLFGKLQSAVLIKKYPTGRMLVQLRDDVMCYKSGDKVNIGPGEFVKDD